MLNKNINYLLILLLTIGAAACSKQKTPEESPATVMLFNALEDGVSVRTNLSGQHPIQYITALLLTPRGHARVHTKQPIQPMAFMQQQTRCRRMSQYGVAIFRCNAAISTVSSCTAESSRQQHYWSKKSCLVSVKTVLLIYALPV